LIQHRRYSEFDRKQLLRLSAMSVYGLLPFAKLPVL
jgi:hypothetical protein